MGFHPKDGFALDEMAQFVPLLVWRSLGLQALFRRERSSSLILLMAEMEADKIPLFLSFQSVEESFPTVYLLQRPIAWAFICMRKLRNRLKSSWRNDTGN